MVSWYLDSEVLSTAHDHLRAIKRCHYINSFSSQIHKTNPHTNIKQNIHPQTPNANFRWAAVSKKTGLTKKKTQNTLYHIQQFNLNKAEATSVSTRDQTLLWTCKALPTCVCGSASRWLGSTSEGAWVVVEGLVPFADWPPTPSPLSLTPPRMGSSRLRPVAKIGTEGFLWPISWNNATCTLRYLYTGVGTSLLGFLWSVSWNNATCTVRYLYTWVGTSLVGFLWPISWSNAMCTVRDTCTHELGPVSWAYQLKQYNMHSEVPVHMSKDQSPGLLVVSQLKQCNIHSKIPVQMCRDHNLLDAQRQQQSCKKQKQKKKKKKKWWGITEVEPAFHYICIPVFHTMLSLDIYKRKKTNVMQLNLDISHTHTHTHTHPHTHTHKTTLWAVQTTLGWKRYTLTWRLTHTHHVLCVNVESVEEVRVGTRLAPLVDYRRWSVHIL